MNFETSVHKKRNKFTSLSISQRTKTKTLLSRNLPTQAGKLIWYFTLHRRKEHEWALWLQLQFQILINFSSSHLFTRISEFLSDTTGNFAFVIRWFILFLWNTSTAAVADSTLLPRSSPLRASKKLNRRGEYFISFCHYYFSFLFEYDTTIFLTKAATITRCCLFCVVFCMDLRKKNLSESYESLFWINI